MSDVPSGRGVRADARRNRERVLQAAQTVFAKQGLSAQMQDVAQQAGVGLGTVYRHFPTKERLAAELVSAGFDRMTTQALHARDEPGDAWDRLVAALRANLADLAADAGTRAAMAGGVAVDLDHGEPARLRHRAALDALLADARAEGAVHDDFQVDDLGMMLCGMSAAMDSRSDVGWERQLRFVLRGIRAVGAGPGAAE
ncbi:MAG TPA: TetR/AcrR family transcriptional regulator [Pseudonocardia sp.]